MNICWSSSGKSERCSQQFRLLSVYLFLWLEHGIDKLLIRDMAVEIVEPFVAKMPLQPLRKESLKGLFSSLLRKE